MIKIPQTLIEELIRRKILDQKTAEAFIQKVKSEDKDFTQIAVEGKIISDSDLLSLKSEFYRLPSVSLKDAEIKPDVLKTLPENIAEFYRIIPFDKEENTLRVGMLNPEDTDALEALKFIGHDLGLAIEKHIISFGDYFTVLKKYRTLSSEVKEALVFFFKL